VAGIIAKQKKNTPSASIHSSATCDVWAAAQVNGSTFASVEELMNTRSASATMLSAPSPLQRLDAGC